MEPNGGNPKHRPMPLAAVSLREHGDPTRPRASYRVAGQAAADYLGRGSGIRGWGRGSKAG